MTSRAHPLYFTLFVLVVAPVGAVVVITALLLFGIRPSTVFAPGWKALSLLQSAHIHAPNAVGVLVTVGVWWLLFVAIGSAWERRRRPPGSRERQN